MLTLSKYMAGLCSQMCGIVQLSDFKPHIFVLVRRPRSRLQSVRCAIAVTTPTEIIHALTITHLLRLQSSRGDNLIQPSDRYHH